MEARDIIIRPLITEKSTTLMAEGKYVFEVAKAANKIEIAKAISQIGKRSDYKKAIVKLAAGETIEFFEA